MTTTITRAKGGTGEREVEIATLQVPDLWHVASFLKDKGHTDASLAVLECWHLCHDLLRHIRESEETPG